MRALPLFGPSEPAARPAGVPVLAKGFRPFFPLAAAFAGFAVPLWLLVLSGTSSAPVTFDPIAWHAHEMIFGFTAAVLAGFLLTAVGNWTGRETATGGALAGLVALWALGRVAVSAGTALPRPIIAAIDLAFLPALAVIILRPLAATGNRRNFVMVGVLMALFASNLVMHLARDAAVVRRASLVAVDIVVLVIALMAGRVVPMFTRNATRLDRVMSSPRLDVAALATVAVVTVLDATIGDAPAVLAVAPGLAAVLLAVRARRWGTLYTGRAPLLWILHLGYMFLPLGFALRAAGRLWSAIPSSSATHALTAGGIGLMTLGMMARVPLGHTGRPLSVGWPMSLAFVLASLAAILRTVAPFLDPSRWLYSMRAAGALFSLAFAIYAVVFTPICLAPRVDGKPG